MKTRAPASFILLLLLIFSASASSSSSKTHHHHNRKHKLTTITTTSTTTESPDPCSTLLCEPGQLCQLSEDGVASCSSSSASEEDEEDSDELQLDSELKQFEEEEENSYQQNSDDNAKSRCNAQEYEAMKDSLLLTTHHTLLHPPTSQPTEKDYLLSLIFSHFDLNNNGALEYSELHKLNDLYSTEACRLTDMLRFDDTDGDKVLSVNEFYVGFSRVYSVTVISLEKALEVRHTTTTVGSNLQLKCDISGSPPMKISWTRNEVDLSSLNDEDVKVFPDGSLNLNNVQLLHAGNYSCHLGRNLEVVQVHVVAVEEQPEVKVTPKISFSQTGEEIELKCRASGEPFPVVQWLKNDEQIEFSDKIELLGDSVGIRLRNAGYSDTGAYVCKAQSSAGTKIDISSLVVLDEVEKVEEQKDNFVLFHTRGITLYDPSNCRVQKQILYSDFVPGTKDLLCPEPEKCAFHSALKVGPYIYVSQPDQDRLLIISAKEFQLVDSISTDPNPRELQYNGKYDQLWIACEREPNMKTLQVIREAAQRKKHSTVHPEPIDSHFDLVENLFLPTSPQFKFAYVSHKNARGLYKMDLKGLRYVKSVDLTMWNCVPKEVQFSAIFGLVIIQCREPVTNRPTGQLILDALTDAVTHYKLERIGRPFLSPDSRRLVTLGYEKGGSVLEVEGLADGGLIFQYEVKTPLNISHLTFFPSKTTHTFDIFAGAADKEDVLVVGIEEGKVELITGVSRTEEISSSGLFNRYVVSPSGSDVFVLNGESRSVNCQIGGLSGGDFIVWME